jgi:cation transport protein ChaC
VAPALRDETIAYLRAREQVTMVYRERWRPMLVRRESGSDRVRALVYEVDQNHVQYAGKRTVHELLPYVLQGHGKGGPCIEYIASTLDHMREQGMSDHHLEEVLALAEAALASSGGKSCE